MTDPFAFPYTISIVRGPETDNWGNPVEGAPTVIISDGWAIAPRTGGPGTSSRDIDARGRQGVVEGFTIMSRDATVDMRHTDTVILPVPFGLPSEVFIVDGEVGRWISPLTGTAFGVEAALRRAVG